MIIVRDVFQAKYGKGDDLVALFKELREEMPADFAAHILTDASGPFFTVVTEIEFENMAAWEQAMDEFQANPEFGEWFQRMVPLVDSGRREFYNVET